jgi:endonuclease YncB( thermonuclease family)
MNRPLLVFTMCILIACTGCSAANAAQHAVAQPAAAQSAVPQDAVPQPAVAHAVPPKTSTPLPLPTTITPTPTAPAATSTTTPSPTSVALPACLPAGAQMQSGKVTGVVDGNTIAVEVDGQAFQVRYIGVAVAAAFSAEATAANRKLVEGKTVTLIKDTTDRNAHGLLPRYVFVGSLFVNDELVRKGMANLISDPPDTACYKDMLQAEQEANAKRVGVWAITGPTQTPWGYGLEKLPAYTPTTIFTRTITPSPTITRTATP